MASLANRVGAFRIVPEKERRELPILRNGVGFPVKNLYLVFNRAGVGPHVVGKGAEPPFCPFPFLIYPRGFGGRGSPPISRHEQVLK